MKQWFESLQPRERTTLSIGAVATVAILFYAFVWEPITTGRENLRTSIGQKQQMLSNLYRASAESAVDGPAETGGQSLFVLIDQTAQTNGLSGAVTRARPNGPNEINVTFTNASFDALVGWLIQLNQNDGILVDGASINNTRERGLVSGQLLLRRL